MTAADADDGTNRTRQPPGTGLAADVVVTDSDELELTLYPHDATEEQMKTCWMTARSGAFVDLGAMR